MNSTVAKIPIYAILRGDRDTSELAAKGTSQFKLCNSLGFFAGFAISLLGDAFSWAALLVCIPITLICGMFSCRALPEVSLECASPSVEYQALKDKQEIFNKVP